MCYYRAWWLYIYQRFLEEHLVPLCTDARLQFQGRKQVLLWLIVASQLEYKVMRSQDLWV